MAELASGAVTSLLGVIRNEWRLLGRVGGDVQFIREEMESMNSFLMHLARTAPPGGEHNEQVRTWMNQVRVLANDCNNCIDLYLYRGNPDIHLGSDRLRRYLRWLPWFLQKMWAQHRAALELSDLKERARDVGKRRLRYGVEVPTRKVAAAPAAAGPGVTAAEGSGEAAAFVQFDGQEQEDGNDIVRTTATDGPDRIRRALFGIYNLEDYFNEMLTEWIGEVQFRWRHLWEDNNTRCAAFLVPSTDDSGAIAREAWAVAEKHVIKKTILVDIPSLHYWRALGPKNILYYILREIQLQTQQEQQGQGEQDDWRRKRLIRKEKRRVIDEIKKNINKMGFVDKIKEITATHIKAVNDSQLQPYLGLGEPNKMEDVNDVQDKIYQEPSLGVLLVLLLMSAAAAAPEETENKAMPTLAKWYDDIINKTAEKLKQHMEQVNKGAGAAQQIIIPTFSQYAHILQQVFPQVSSASKPQQALEQDTKQATIEATPGKNQVREIVDKVKQEILSEVFADQVKKMVDEAKLEILQQLKECKPGKEQATSVPGRQDQTAKVEALAPAEETKSQLATISNLKKQDTEKTKILDATIEEEIKTKMEDVQRKVQRQLHINGIVDKIKSHLNGAETLIILKIDHKYVDEWEQTRNALNLLPNIAVVMILTKTKSSQKWAKEEYCYPKGGEPIDSSLAALYHGIVLHVTSQHKNEDSCDPQIFRTILDKCEPNQLCMKIFARALYAKPKRSKEELHKLQDTLQGLPTKSYRSNAIKMFKFSYRDMPKDYQSCLLYLAIFPRGYKIRRSTLIGRWVAEGIITTEDWRWSSSVQRAEQCFDALITRGLVYSAETETSATGRVKSCMVGDLVHEFITEIAKKQRIVEARLSHHLARHFSIFNDLHLRGSDKIDAFLKSSPESSQWSRLKVLDLEGCTCFMENRRYLKNICNNIFLLKYLSLRGTDINWLPREINNLRELEVLDIQQTEVPESCTRDLLLLKLKRLLAGNKNPSLNSTGIGTSSHQRHHVLVPQKIEKMLDMEVLSNVKAKSSQDFDGITKLWQLRKLGVVVKFSQLDKLLQAISDLHECLRTLSITVDSDTTKSKDLRELKQSPKNIEDSPKVLERLSISGNIPEELLPRLLNVSTLIKVTLSNNTSMSQKILDVLSNLSMLHCLKLRDNTYDHNKLTFKNGKFEKLKYLLVEGSNRVGVSFEDEAAKELEKIVLSFDSIQSITGVDHLPKLEELELNNNIKSSNNSGGITALPQPATSLPLPTTATAIANDPVLSTTTATDPAHSTPTAAVVAAVANEPVLSTKTATDPAQSTPTAAAAPIPSSSAPAATEVASDPIPSTAIATNSSPTAPTTSAATTIPTTSNNYNILFLKLLHDAKQIVKVTLRGMMLRQDDLQSLVRLENIRCMVLLRESYGESKLNFKKDEFPKLNLLIVNCRTITDIIFDCGSAPKLEKIVWTFDQKTSLSGIENLPRLKELEFTGDSLPIQVKEGIDKHKDTIHCTHYKPESQDQTVRSTEKGDSVPSRLHIWKDKVWCKRRN